MVFPSTFSLFVFWAGAAMCAVAEAAVIHRAMSRPDAEPAPAGDDDARTGAAAIRVRGRGTAGEVIWALIPAIVLTLVFSWTWSEMHRAPASALPDHPNAPTAHGTIT